MQTPDTIINLQAQNPSPSPEGRAPVSPQTSASPQNPAVSPGPDDPTPRSHLTGRRRQGKIARLPKFIRDQINLMLDDGLSYPDIIEKLTDPHAVPLPYPINEHHLSEWKSGGYQDYLKDQLWRDQILSRAETFSGLADDDAVSLPAGGLQLASLTVCELLRDLSRLDSSRETDPDQLVRIAHALSRLSRSILQLQEHRAIAEKERLASRPMMDPRRELTDDERHAIVRHVDRILGIDQYEHDFENQIPSLGIIRLDHPPLAVPPGGNPKPETKNPKASPTPAPDGYTEPQPAETNSSPFQPASDCLGASRSV